VIFDHPFSIPWRFTQYGLADMLADGDFGVIFFQFFELESDLRRLSGILPQSHAATVIEIHRES